MLVIAHRLSTIRDADIIAVVSHGRIAEVRSLLGVCLHAYLCVCVCVCVCMCVCVCVCVCV